MSEHLKSIESAPCTPTDYASILDVLVPLIENEFDDVTVQILKGKSPAERMRMASQMYKSVRVMLRGAIATEHPDWTTDQVNREIAKRISHGLITDEMIQEAGCTRRN